MNRFKDYLTIKEASKLLGVSAPTLRRWDNSGKLKALRHPINKYRLYKKETLKEVLREVEPAKINNGICTGEYL